VTVLAVLLGLLLAVVVVTAATIRHPRFWTIWLAEVAPIGASLLLAVLAYGSDYRDADGIIDCNDYCSTFQRAVEATLLLAPIALGFLGVMAAVAVRWRRGPRAE